MDRERPIAVVKGFKDDDSETKVFGHPGWKFYYGK
jgi:hypothetical protein